MNRKFRKLQQKNNTSPNYELDDFGGEVNNLFSNLISGKSNSNEASTPDKEDQINALSVYGNNKLSSCNKLSSNLSRGSTAVNTLSLENNEAINQIESFLSQNLINFDEILKFIVIGDKSTGKSLFVNRFTSGLNSLSNMKYQPTVSLEIKKTFAKLMDKNIKIELWDTNISVQNSPIIKSKFFKFNFLAYYKISNGFILIADYERIDSFTSLEKQIENIINLSNFHNNIFFIVNQRIVPGKKIVKYFFNIFK